MKHQSKQNAVNLEKLISVCGGLPQGDELPQVATPSDLIIQTLQERTGDPISDIQADLTH